MYESTTESPRSAETDGGQVRTTSAAQAARRVRWRKPPNPDKPPKTRLPEASPLAGHAARPIDANAIPTLDVGVVDDAQLLSCLLGCTRELAERLLAKAGTIARLGRFSLDDLIALTGASHDDAVKIAAAFELGRRSVLYEARPAGPLLGAAALARWFKLRMGAAFVQEIWVAGIDDFGGFRAVCRASRGDVHGSLLAGTDIIRIARRMRVTTLVLAHNHPSGSLAITPHDLEFVLRVRRAVSAAGIELADCLLVGPAAGYTSFVEQGVLPGRT